MRRSGARPPAAALTMLALVALVGGCATVRPMVQPKPWDRQADSGPLSANDRAPASSSCMATIGQPARHPFSCAKEVPGLDRLDVSAPPHP